MDNNNPETLFIECECGDPRDQLILHSFSSEKGLFEEPLLYATTFLSPQYRFTKRLKYAWMYITKGIAPKYGHFGCTLISLDDAIRIKDFISDYIDYFDNMSD